MMVAMTMVACKTKKKIFLKKKQGEEFFWENVEKLEALGSFKRKNKEKIWTGGGKGVAQLEGNGALELLFFSL
jgi:hypothetical protein